MFTSQQASQISALGESDLITLIKSRLGTANPATPIGMGDDCAIVDLPQNTRQIITTDSLSYRQHFDEKVSALDAGAKLVKRNLSDIAAMGGRPGQALLTLMCGHDLSIEWLEQFVDGIRETCQAHNLSLVGGDISALAKGQFSSVLCLTGYLDYAPLLRSGAQVGDWIYVTGSLGGSLRSKHYAFTPRLAEGQWLAQSGLCHALMDLTDGLAKDLRELIPADCQAQLNLDHIPLSPDAAYYATTSGRSAMEHAFCDGEDYELLFAIKSEANLAAFEQSWRHNFPDTPLSKIGRFCPGSGEDTCKAPYLDAQSKEALPWIKGFEHLVK